MDRLSVPNLNDIHAAVRRHASMPEILRILIHILQKCSYRAPVGGDQNCFVQEGRIMNLFVSEVLSPCKNICNDFSVLCAF